MDALINMRELHEVGGKPSCYELNHSMEEGDDQHRDTSSQKPSQSSDQHRDNSVQMSSPILNACLALVKGHMFSRDRVFICDATCAKLLAGNGNIALSAGAAPPEKTGGHALPRVLDINS